MPAGVIPTVLDAFATTGGRPTATSTGKLRSVATPTVEVRIPAPKPAPSTASCSRPVTSCCATRPVAHQRDVRVAGLDDLGQAVSVGVDPVRDLLGDLFIQPRGA